ncbi:MAG TPA: FAD-binding oxidoreductase [Gaiellales bacterium]
MTLSTSLDAGQLESLAAGFGGTLLLPSDDGYEAARKIHNGLIDRRPALIARCSGTSDIAAAVRFARQTGLALAVRGGGHNVAGRAVPEDGLMIDLSQMKGIHIDAAAATVRAQGGVTWAELNREAAVHGLAVTGGAISSTGIAGYTLGGGLGWLMSTQGLAADNLVGVQLVTAEGEVLDVTDASHPDLMWALRGGGGNFGVAASFEFRLRPQAMVVGGLIAHPIEAGADMLRFYRDVSATCPDELTVFAALAHAPDGSGMPIAGMIVCHTDPERADADLAPYLRFGSPIVTQVGPMPYPIMNTLLDDAYPRGALNYWMSSFTTGMDDALIDTVVERFGSVPSPMTAILFEHFHGAVTRVDPAATAVPHREAGWNLLFPSEWIDPADTEKNIAWTKDTYAAVSEHLVARKWLNYLNDDEDGAVRAAYGPNFDRLVSVKRQHDPQNVFRGNHNIAP